MPPRVPSRRVSSALALVSALVPALVLAACGPAPDRIGPDRDRLATDDLARQVLQATGVALRLPAGDVRGTADARRCDDRTEARHQVDADFDADLPDLAVARDDLVRALGAAGVPVEEARDGDARVLRGSIGRSSYDVRLAADEQVVTVRSECLDVGRVQAVEVSFAERYAVRPGEVSPER